MRKIELKELRLLNFKGQKDLIINFKSNTNIFGANGTGKTTIFDAFTWLLFGKDSSDKKDFNIKTLDTNNNPIHQIEHEVSGIIQVDSETHHLKRIYKENWIKKRGALVSELNGHKTLYYFNDIPLSEKEYQNKVNDILNENLFKLITNPFAFAGLKWQEQRNVLTNIAPTISDQELIQNDKDIKKLFEELGGRKDINDFKKQIAVSIKKSKEDLIQIPTRIDEVVRNKPEEKDFQSLEANLKEKETELKSIDEMIEDRSQYFKTIANEKEAQIEEKLEIAKKIAAIKTNARQQAEIHQNNNNILPSLELEVSTKEENINHLNLTIQSLESRLKNKENDVLEKEIRQADLRKQWTEENKKTLVYTEEEFMCPTCKRKLDDDDIYNKKEELLKNFNNNRKKILEDINIKGNSLGAEKENIIKEINNLKETLSKNKEQIITLKEQIHILKEKINKEKELNKTKISVEQFIENFLANNSDYQLYNEAYNEINKKINSNIEPDLSEFKEKKTKIQREIDSIKRELAVKSQIESSNKRIEELKKQEKELSQIISDDEKKLFTIERFEKIKMTKLEESINCLFNYIKFKLFDTQINGSEIPCCELLVNGVPYQDVNTSGKINAGLDVINALTKFYQTEAPIFIDNRESVIDIIPTSSQIINLFVSKDDKTIRIQ